jgi:SAM-dependent methyltransferase
MRNNLNYYLWTSLRRKKLDKIQNKYKYLYKGVVLDIGGRDRGRFKKPKEKVDKWIFADIEEKHNPDIVLDVSNMKQLKDESIDVISAMELFEHVEEIEKGLSECYRVLKKGGEMIISVPFLYQIHGDPYDFQRWTEVKWKKELEKRGFKIEKFIIMGRFFTVLGDMLKKIIKLLPWGIKHFIYLLLPLIDCLVFLDNFNFVKKNELGNFHGGYFVILKK